MNILLRHSSNNKKKGLAPPLVFYRKINTLKLCSNYLDKVLIKKKIIFKVFQYFKKPNRWAIKECTVGGKKPLYLFIICHSITSWSVFVVINPSHTKCNTEFLDPFTQLHVNSDFFIIHTKRWYFWVI